MELALDGPLLSCGGFLINGLSRGFVMKNYTGLEVGLHESAIAPGLSCYPNPTSGALTIAGVTNAKELIVRDALGRVVLRFSMPTDNMTIILHGLPAGAYLLELVSPGQLLGRTRFVRE